METSILSYGDQINLYDVLITVQNIILSLPLTQKLFNFFSLYFSYVKQTDLLARISTLERENVELKEKVKAIEENFQSERGKGNFRKNNWAF